MTKKEYVQAIRHIFGTIHLPFVACPFVLGLKIIVAINSKLFSLFA
jgi:hypothetical protein